MLSTNHADPLISHSGVTEHLLRVRHSVGITDRQPCLQKEVSEPVCELCVGLCASSQLRARDLSIRGWVNEKMNSRIKEARSRTNGHCVGLEERSGMLECCC